MPEARHFVQTVLLEGTPRTDPGGLRLYDVCFTRIARGIPRTTSCYSLPLLLFVISRVHQIPNLCSAEPTAFTLRTSRGGGSSRNNSKVEVNFAKLLIVAN
jgi:hypothetical protein